LETTVVKSIDDDIFGLRSQLAGQMTSRMSKVVKNVNNSEMVADEEKYQQTADRKSGFDFRMELIFH
jgi:hypothetical protein